MGKGNVIRDNSIKKKDKNNTKGLRGAYLIRVSDEGMVRKKQEGEELCDSSRLQKDAMKRAADNLETIWNEKYLLGGKEHQHTTKQYVTDAFEREDIQILSRWIVNKEIDFVMIAYSDRTGRFSPVSKQIYELLRIHDIRLFELETEYDLDDPNTVLILGIKAEIAEYKTNLDQNRAYEAKLDNAEKYGIYKGGNIQYPYMKNPNGTDPYRIADPEKKMIWNKVRSLYSKNGGRNKYTTDVLTEMFPPSNSTINRILFSHVYHTGRREVHFNKKRAVQDYKEVDKVVETQDYEIIGKEEEYNELIRIRDSRKRNKVNGYTRYFFKKRILCGHSGQWMSGFKNQRTGELGYLCYSDNKLKKKTMTRRGNGCGLRVPEGPFKKAFLRELAMIFSDPEKLKIALGKEGERFKEIREAREIIQQRIAKIQREDKNLITAIKHAENDEEVKGLNVERRELIAKKCELENEDKTLEEEASNLPNIDGIIPLLNPRLPAIIQHINKADGFAGYSDEEQRRLLEYIFPPSNPKNRKYGITVWKIKKGHYRFEANCVIDDKMFGEFYADGKGWEMQGRYSGKSYYALH